MKAEFGTEVGRNEGRTAVMKRLRGVKNGLRRGIGGVKACSLTKVMRNKGLLFDKGYEE